MSQLKFHHNLIFYNSLGFITTEFWLSLSFVTLEVFPTKVLGHFKFYKSFGLVSIQFILKNSVTFWYLFQFVLPQLKFVTIWVVLQLKFFFLSLIIGLSHFRFSPYCKFNTLWGFFLFEFGQHFSCDIKKNTSHFLFLSSSNQFLH